MTEPRGLLNSRLHGESLTPNLDLTMPLDPAVRDALDDVLRDEPQSDELKSRVRQLVSNWFDHNSTDDDVIRVVRQVRVNIEQDD